MSGFEELFGQFLLLIIPEPLVWAFILVLIFGVSMAFARLPGSIAAQFSFILIWVMNDYLGGPFNLMHMLMLVGLGIMIVLAFFKLGNR